METPYIGRYAATNFLTRKIQQHQPFFLRMLLSTPKKNSVKATTSPGSNARNLKVIVQAIGEKQGSNDNSCQDCHLLMLLKRSARFSPHCSGISVLENPGKKNLSSFEMTVKGFSNLSSRHMQAHCFTCLAFVCSFTETKINTFLHPAVLFENLESTACITNIQSPPAKRHIRVVSFLEATIPEIQKALKNINAFAKLFSSGINALRRLFRSCRATGCSPRLPWDCL